jgi:hypothetical protein
LFFEDRREFVECGGLAVLLTLIGKITGDSLLRRDQLIVVGRCYTECRRAFPFLSLEFQLTSFFRRALPTSRLGGYLSALAGLIDV